MKSVITVLSLAPLLSAAVLADDIQWAETPSEEAVSNLSPREWQPTSFMGGVTQLFLSRFNKVDFSQIVSEMKAEGVEEEVIISQISAEGFVMSFTRDDRYNSNSFQKSLRDWDVLLVPMKIKVSSDGSVEYSVALVTTIENKQDRFDDFWTWISIDKFTAFEYTNKVDETRNLVQEKTNYLDLNTRIGIWQTQNLDHNFYATLGLKYGYFDQYEFYGEDGYKYSLHGGHNNEVNIGTKYVYGTADKTQFQVEAGAFVKDYSSEASTIYDDIAYQNNLDIYNAGYDAYIDAMANYLNNKNTYAASININPLDYSSDDYYEATGVRKPEFSEEGPSELTESEISYIRKGFYGKMSWTKYLQSGVRVGVHLDGVYNTNNTINAPAIDTMGSNKYYGNLSISVEY